MAKKVEPKNTELSDEDIIGKRETLVSGAGFHNFKEQPIFEGYYVGEQIGRDQDTSEEKVIGYLFDVNEHEQKIVSNSHAITKALNGKTKSGVIARESGRKFIIEFMGQTEKNGRRFNNFRIDLE